MGFKGDKRKGAIVISDDDAEAEEVETRKRRKSEASSSGKKKKKKSSFVDDAAGCSDMEDDEADDDELEDSDEEAVFNEEQINVREFKRIVKRSKLASSATPFVDDEDEGEGEGGDEDLEDDDEDVEERSNLWKVKCKIGQEQEAVVTLLERDRRLHRSGRSTLTKCAIAPTNATGFILVEAISEEKMRKACQGCGLLKLTSPVMLTEKAVKDILTNRDSARFRAGDKVRLKTGVYRGDVAEILEVLHSRQQARVKVLPRIKLDELHLKHNRKLYPRKPIYVEDARKLNLPVRFKDDHAGRSLYIINNKLEFWEGYLIKAFPLKNLELETKDVEQSSPRFAVGDKVKIIDGKFKDAIGQVDHVTDNDVHVRLGIQKVSFKSSLLTKHFEPGTLVRIKSGPHQDTTGMVVNVDGAFVIVSSDPNKDDIRVSKDIVQEEREYTVPAVSKIGEYQLHDLVALTSSATGMILKMEKGVFHILTTEQKVLTVNPSDVQRKISDKFAVTQDAAGNAVRLMGMVRVQSGPRRGKQGRVEHIYGRLLFVYDRQVLDTNGFFCTNASDCLLIGGQKTPLPNQLKSPVKTGVPRLRNPLLGKVVKVRRGPYKGYMGRVKRALNNYYYVFLDAMKKEVKVQYDQVASLEPPPPKEEENADAGGENGKDDGWGDTDNNKTATDDGWGGNNNAGNEAGGGWGDNEADGGGDEKTTEDVGGWGNAETGGDEGGGWGNDDNGGDEKRGGEAENDHGGRDDVGGDDGRDEKGGDEGGGWGKDGNGGDEKGGGEAENDHGGRGEDGDDVGGGRDDELHN